MWYAKLKHGKEKTRVDTESVVSLLTEHDSTHDSSILELCNKHIGEEVDVTHLYPGDLEGECNSTEYTIRQVKKVKSVDGEEDR